MEAFGVVYLITCLVNGKKYVGQTTQALDKRINQHKYGDQYIDRAIRKYGWENFTVEVLKECKSKEELDYWEKYFIKVLNTKRPNGYNLTDGGEGISGLEFTAEHRKNISAARTGKPLSAEHRAKIGASISGEKNPFFGKTHTNKVRVQMSEIHLGETPYKNLIAELRARQLLCLDLAKFLGIACSNLSQKMRGKRNFTAKDISKIEELFQKPVAYLFERDDGVIVIPFKRRETPFKNLANELTVHKLTQAALAEFLGIACSTLSCKMHGTINFKDSEKKKLAEILGKPIEYLLQRSE